MLVVAHILKETLPVCVGIDIPELQKKVEAALPVRVGVNILEEALPAWGLASILEEAPPVWVGGDILEETYASMGRD